MSQSHIKLPESPYGASNAYERRRARREAAQREAQSAQAALQAEQSVSDGLPPEGPRRILPGEVIKTASSSKAGRNKHVPATTSPFSIFRKNHDKTAGKTDLSAPSKSRISRRRNAHAEASKIKEQRQNRREAKQHLLGRIVSFVTASPARIKGTIALVVIALLLLAIYPPLRDFYVARRNEARLSAQYTQLKDKHGELMGEIERLQTQEGIEDEARKRGYVKDGETGVVVEGIEGGSEQSAEDDKLSAQEARKPHEEAPTQDTRSWQQKLLDFFFQYHEEDAGL